MKLNDLTETFYTPPTVDLSNTFDVVEHVNGNGTVDSAYNYNISCGIVDISDIPKRLIRYYMVRQNDTLKLISYKLFDTIDFWWLIAKINHIDDVLAPLTVGAPLITFDKQTMGAIYSEVLQLSKSTDTTD